MVSGEGGFLLPSEVPVDIQHVAEPVHLTGPQITPDQAEALAPGVTRGYVDQCSAVSASQC